MLPLCIALLSTAQTFPPYMQRPTWAATSPAAARRWVLRSRFGGALPPPTTTNPAPPEEPSVTLRGGDNAELDLTLEQRINLIADPLLSSEGRRAIERELVEEQVASIPGLIAHLGDPRTIAGGRTVGQHAERMLYQIVIGDYRSPYERPLPRNVTRPIVVADWPRWWAQRKDRAIETIQDEMADAIDRFWREGRTQVLN
jgi:hypothetical protein